MPEVTTTYVKWPIVNEKEISTYYGLFDIDKKNGIRGLYGKLKKGGRAVVSVWFLLSKGWTLKKAEVWVKEHKEGLTNVSKKAKNIRVKLPSCWRKYILNLPESGMGYQKVSIKLNNGVIIQDALIFNAEEIEIPWTKNNINIFFINIIAIYQEGK